MIEWFISSGVLILMILMIRRIFQKRLSLRVRYALWGVVVLRLLVPVSFFESSLSVLNLLEKLPLTEEWKDGMVSLYETDQQNLWNDKEFQENWQTADIRLQSNSGLPEREVILPAAGKADEEVVLSSMGRVDGKEIIPAADKADGKEILSATGIADEEEMLPATGIANGEVIVLPVIERIDGKGMLFPAGNTEKEGVLVLAGGTDPETENGRREANSLWWRHIWVSGICISLGFVAVVNFRYWKCVYRSRRRYHGAEESRLPVYVSTVVRIPCMFGLIHPAIYLNQEDMEEKTLRYVLCHENTHYRHKDNLWTFVRLFCVCLHWFNPLVWLAAYLSKQDCELACDEETIVLLGDENRIDYGRTLLALSMQKEELFGGLRFSTTISGRKNQLKERLQMIAVQPKKKRISVVMVSLLIFLTAAVTFTGSKTAFAQVGLQNVDNESTRPELYNGNSVFYDEENKNAGNETGSSKAVLYESNAAGTEETFKVNNTYLFLGQEEGMDYSLQVFSKPVEESGHYEIIQVDLCRVYDGVEEVLQSICPGDVKPLYVKSLHDSRNARDSDVQQFAFRAEGEPVYAKPLRKFEELSTYGKGSFLADGSGTQLSNLSDGGIRIMDLNFDGYDDFCLQIGVGSVNQPFYCYLWNPQEKLFEHSAMIPNVKVDRESQLIESATQDGEEQHSVKYYRFDALGNLHLIRYVEENQSPDAVFPFLDLTYEETSYGLPAVDDWDAETEYGGALNERYIYWAKEALTELYEWSGTKIDTACFAVTCFGSFSFGRTPQDLNVSRIFYSRTYGAKAGFIDVIENMNLCTERVTWFSPVIQWKVPEHLEDMTDEQVVEWYFTRSAFAEGEVMEISKSVQGEDYVIKTTLENYYEIMLNRASREVENIYGPYNAYPFH